MQFELMGKAGKTTLLNLTEKPLFLQLNKESISLKGSEEKDIFPAENIPADKKEFFTADFLEEDPAFVMKNPKTPY